MYFKVFRINIASFEKCLQCDFVNLTMKFDILIKKVDEIFKIKNFDVRFCKKNPQILTKCYK